jgi:uncharacterized repeat protein (TIGR01451 family)
VKTSLRRLIPVIGLMLATVSGVAKAQAGALVVTAANRTAEVDAAKGMKRSDTNVRGGDVMKYTLTFTNLKEKSVRQVVMSNPIPSGLKLIGNSARSSREDAITEYSADAGRTFSAQPMEEVILDGRAVQRAVSPDRYTHVRWTIAGSIAPRAVVTAAFEARLGPAGSAANVASR